MEYLEFLETKKNRFELSGFDCDNIDNISKLFDFQSAIVKWALKKGRAAVFADTGLGKTMIQAAWAHCVHKKTKQPVLIVAPLCVAQQTCEEAKKIDIHDIVYVTEHPEGNEIYITNYERLDSFDMSGFAGIVLDESSILKHQDSKTRTKIIAMCKDVAYRLSCTATPSPNDFMELGSQVEFLGHMKATEMLAMFFTHDSGETSKWRLKGHARQLFWKWMATWCIYIKNPSDIGFLNTDYNLPELKIIHHEIDSGLDINDFLTKSKLSLLGRNKARKATLGMRVDKASRIVNNSKGSFLVWCNLNDESEKLTDKINGAVEVKGGDKLEKKEDRIMGFTHKEYRVLVTKPKIAGFGMNWQHCNQMIFVGLNDSYEQLYQAIRRCYRFGQPERVIVHIVTSDIEGEVLENINRKEKQATEMQNELVGHMKDFQTEEVSSTCEEKAEYKPRLFNDQNFTMVLADCVDHTKSMGDESVDYSIFSPPFASLYTYSNSNRDMGNSKNYDEFWIHFKFLIKELFRTLLTGRNISVHCANIPTMKSKEGFIGIKDFRGDIIRAFQDVGFIYHSEVTIWKNPVVAMRRTKALGLLWKQIKKDSSMSRQGLPDYLVTFRKDGINTKPLQHNEEQFPVEKWQQYASPCWNDINQSNTLNGRMARTGEDERHICALQLDVIERAMELWSIPNDLVYSPFAGIGSEGYVSLSKGRRFLGCEIKESYFELACKYLKDVKTVDKYKPIFSKTFSEDYDHKVFDKFNVKNDKNKKELMMEGVN